MPEEWIGSFRKSLHSRAQFGLAIMYPAAGIVERIAPDWDWIWIDGQHGEFSYPDIIAAVRACDFRARPAVVRVPGLDAGAIGVALDMGAAGVMVPQVDTPEQARTAVEASRFAPLGRRSFGGRRVIDLYGREYADEPALQPLLICQIESPGAVACASRIAATEGVDVIFFGPDDMSLKKGFRMAQPRAEDVFDAELRAVALAARDAGKVAGGVFTTDKSVRKALELGYRLIVSGADVGLLAQGSRDLAHAMRQYCGSADA